MNQFSMDSARALGTRRRAAAWAIVGLLATLPLAAPAAAQYCSDTPDDGVLVEMIPDTDEVPSDEPRCLGAFYCEVTEIGGPQPVAVFNPETGDYTVRVTVPLTMRDNSKNDGTDGTDVGFRAKVHWFDKAEPDPVTCFPGFNGCEPLESCGPLGATIDFDFGYTAISIGGLKCENLEGDPRLKTYSFSVLRCATPAGTCTSRADSPPIALTPAAVGALLECPRKHTCCPDPCKKPCPPGTETDPTGAGPARCPKKPRDGAGAALGYAARGAGTSGLPGSDLWRPVLGRGWSHDYAERIVPSPDDSHIWLITRFGTYREFWRPVGGVYQEASPSDEYRTLTRTPSGWDLRDLDGTVASFDAEGRWAGTADASGNSKLPTYDPAGTLSEVAFPDGRSERFTYHPDGKLAGIEEIGGGGAVSRAWSYTWNGDDLARIDRPDGTAAEYFYNDPRHPGFLTRVDEVATDGARRVDRGYELDAEGSVVRTWRGDTAAGTNGDVPGPQAVDSWSFGFDDPTRPTQAQVTDPLGGVSTYVFDRDPRSDTPRLTSISGDCPSCGLGANSQLFYDDPDNPLLPTRTIDGRGTQTLITYDANGQMTSKTEAFGTAIERTMIWEYADPTFPARVTSMEEPSTSGAGSRETRISLDGAGNEVSRTLSGIEDGSAFSLETVTTRTPEGQPESVDPPGYGLTDRTSFAYDPVRGGLLPSSRTDPLLGAVTFGYDGFNRRTSTTDHNGVVTETVYDALDRVRFTIQKGAIPAEDLITEQVYNSFGDLERTILPEGNVIEYDYDDVGRLTSTSRGPAPGVLLERTVLELDDNGNRTREEQQRWEGAAWVTHSSADFVYSSRCKLDKVIYPDGTATEYAYDCNGNTEHVWDANHPSAAQTATPSQTFGYDELNRLISVSRPWAGDGGGQSTIGYGYDVQDNQVSVTDAEGNLTTYEYSDRGLMSEMNSEISGRTTFAYNDHGELIRQVDARGVVTRHTVDALNRRLFTDYPDDSLDTTFTYDDPAVPFSTGRLTSITRAGSSVDFTYDRFGRRTGDGALAYSYDRNGNRVTITYPGDVVATHTYDFADRQDSLTLQRAGEPAQPIVTGADYLPAGPLAELSFGNGQTETREFDGRYFPLGIGLGSHLDWDYSTDAVGNIASITDPLHGQSRLFDRLDYSYFLTRADGPWGDLSWTYDRIGNRLSETRDGLTESYRYDLNASGGRTPRLTSLARSPGAINFFYDPAGNQTYQQEETVKRRLDYDATGRLAQITLDRSEDPGSLTHLRYDGRSFLTTAEHTSFPGRPPAITTSLTYGSEDGVLHHKRSTETAGPAPPRGEGPTTTDDFNLLFAGRPIALFKLVTGLDEQGQPVETTQIYFLTADHLGAPIVALDGAGSLVWRAGLEPFGADYSGASALGIDLRLPGQFEDDAWRSSGLVYNLHRWYRPETGRYLRSDPFQIRADTALQLYAYADGRPLFLIDPFGLCTCMDDCPDGKWTYTGTSWNWGFMGGFAAGSGLLQCQSKNAGGFKSQIRVRSRCGLAGAFYGSSAQLDLTYGNVPAMCACNFDEILDPDGRSGWFASAGGPKSGGAGGGFSGCHEPTVGPLKLSGTGGFSTGTFLGGGYMKCWYFPWRGPWDIVPWFF